MSACCFACPECGERFSAADALRMPAGLSCGHTLCAECAEAILLCVPPTCTVCKVPVADKVTPGAALAAFCDDSAKKRHQGAPQAASKKPRLEANDGEEERRGRYVAAAAAASAASRRVVENMAALLQSADEAVAKVQDAAAHAKASIDHIAADRVAAIRDMAARGTKQLLVQQDELEVRASQLHAAAAAGASAPEILPAFQVLARKSTACVSFRVDAAVRECDAAGLVQVALLCAAEPPKLKRQFARKRESNGLAISRDGSQFAVSHGEAHVISVHCAWSGALVRAFGAWGAGMGQFKSPEKLVYHPGSDNILVADGGNRRIQEVKPTGEPVRLMGVGMIDAEICGIACNGALVAVGVTFWRLGRGRVMLFEYGSGDLTRSFGDWGSGVGYLGRCQALRFTPDGRHVVVATYTTTPGVHKLSQWSTEGVFVKEAGVGALKFVTDVACAENGDWIACDQVGDEIVEFSGADGSETRRWRGADTDAGTDAGSCSFTRPTALAISCHGELFVLEKISGRVLVFA